MPKIKQSDLESVGFKRATDGWLYHHGPSSDNTHLHLGAYGSGFKPLEISYLSAKFADQGIGNLGYSAISKEFKTHRLDEVSGHSEAVSDFTRVIRALNSKLMR